MKEKFSISDYISIQSNQSSKELDNYINDLIEERKMSEFDLQLKPSFFDGMTVAIIKSDLDRPVLESRVFKLGEMIQGKEIRLQLDLDCQNNLWRMKK